VITSANAVANVIVSLPQRSDRRAGFGPFPSARDALKFATYAAIGALLIPALGLWIWLPFLGVGFVVSMKKIDGESPEKRLADYVSFCWRRARSLDEPPKGSSIDTSVPSRRAFSAGGKHLAAFVATGIPVAALPAPDLQRLFVSYREFLRASDLEIYLTTISTPTRASDLRPGTEEVPEESRRARDGYRELVSLLCRRWRQRRVILTFSTLDLSGRGLNRFEASIQDVVERLAALGIGLTRLKHRSLSAALERLGWAIPGSKG